MAGKHKTPNQNVQRILGVQLERPYQELQNEPPLEMYGAWVQIPFNAEFFGGYRKWSKPPES